MKNLHYDLVKLLHCLADVEWRIDKHYAADAEGCDSCKKIFEKIKNDASEGVKLLTEEIAKHGKLD